MMNQFSSIWKFKKNQYVRLADTPFHYVPMFLAQEVRKHDSEKKITL